MNKGWNGLQPVGRCYHCQCDLSNQGRGRKYYCDWNCMKKRPPKQVLLEDKENKPFKEILLEKLNKAGTITLAADFLGMYPNELREHMKRFGIERVVKFE